MITSLKTYLLPKHTCPYERSIDASESKRSKKVSRH